MYDLQKLLQPQIDLIIQAANITRQKIKRKLETDYARELQPNHQPRFWDPYKARHREKVAMAHALKAKLEKNINSIHDFEELIALLETQKRRNEVIDPKGGRYSKILSSEQYALELVHAKVAHIHSYTKNEVYWKSKLLRHFISIQKEALLESSFKLRAVDLGDFKNANDYHGRQIKQLKDHLVKLCLQACDEFKIHIDKDELNKSVENISKELVSKLDEIELEVHRTSDKVPDEALAERKCKAKLTYLQDQLHQLQHEQLREEIFHSCINVHSLSELSLSQKLKKFLLAELLNQFCDQSKMDQKLVFWQFVLGTLNNPKSYLEGTERKHRRDCWYKGCYSEHLDEKFAGFPKKEIMDPLNLDALSRELKSLDSDGGSVDSLLMDLQQTFDAYFEKHVNEEDFKGEAQYHKILLFRAWRKELLRNAERLSEAVETTFKFVDRIFAGEVLSASHKRESYYIELISFVLKQLDHNKEVEIKVEPNVMATYNASSSRLFTSAQKNSKPDRQLTHSLKEDKNEDKEVETRSFIYN